MTRPAHRHLSAAVGALSAVALLSVAVFINGYRALDSPFWIANALSVAVVAYVLVVLADRAASFQDGLWRRAAAFGAAAGGVVAPLVLVDPAALNATGVGLTGVGLGIVLTSALGATFGLAAVEGLRWVRSGAPRRAA